MKNKVMQYKKPLAVVFVLVLVLVGYFTRDKWMSFFTKSDTTNPVNNANSATNTSTGTNNASTVIDKTKVLKRGDSGASVKELQRLINTKLSAPLIRLVEDGNFGAKTEAALIQVYGANSCSINQLEAKLVSYFPNYLPINFTS